MTTAPHPSLLMTLGVGALVAWRLYSRVRRMVGRQTFSRRRAGFTVVLFPLLLLLLLVVSLPHPASAASLLGGAALGIGLGFYGLRLTKFEATPEGLFYTPNAHLGIALSLLLIARIGYRMLQAWLGADMPAGPPEHLLRSPLTLLIFGTLAAYYVSYAIGLLRWSRRTATPPAA